jgi:cell division protease FtsH
MVTEYGMSAAVGAVRLSGDDADPFTRAMEGSSHDHSDMVTATVDSEVSSLLDAAYGEAWNIIIENREVLDVLAARLLEEETIGEAEIREIFAGVRKAPEREHWQSSPGRRAPEKPPIPLPQESEGE